MTAGELLVGAASKTATSTALKIAKERNEEHKAINKALLDDVRQTPEFKQATKLYGARQAIRQAIATTWWRRFAWLNRVPDEYLDNDFVADLASKIDNIPDDDLELPKRSVARRALEGLDDAADEPNLREMYLELLARAFDSKFSDLAHPSFVEIIKQLTAAEATYLRQYLTTDLDDENLPIAQLNIVHRPGIAHDTYLTHLLPLTNEHGPTVDRSIAAYVDNWTRLGLIEVTYDAYVTGDHAYDWVTERPEYQQGTAFVAARPLPDDGETTSFEIEIAEGLLRATAFGRSFALAVGMLGILQRPQ